MKKTWKLENRVLLQHSIVIVVYFERRGGIRNYSRFSYEMRRSQKTWSRFIEGLARINEDPEYLGRPRGIYDAAPTATAEITN